MIEFYFSAAEFSAILHFSLWIAFLLHCLPNRIIISSITFSISTAPTPLTACSRLQTVVGYSFDFTTPESRIVFILVLGHTIITSSPICKILSSLVCSNLDLVSLYFLSPFCSSLFCSKPYFLSLFFLSLFKGSPVSSILDFTSPESSFPSSLVCSSLDSGSLFSSSLLCSSLFSSSLFSSSLDSGSLGSSFLYCSSSLCSFLDSVSLDSGFPVCNSLCYSIISTLYCSSLFC